MATYDSIISRADAGPLMPEDVSAEVLRTIPQNSVVMQLARRLPNMARAQRRLPVVSTLPSAYFVDGDTGLKQTSEVNWANKYIDAEELAVIFPISQAVLDDAAYDIWAESQPLIAAAIGKAVDEAVLYGANIPASWTTNLGAAGIVAGANAAGHQISAAAFADLYEAILGASAMSSGLFGLVEEDGFMINGVLAWLGMKQKLRNVRATTGELIFSPSLQQAGAYTLDGAPCIFPTNGAIDATKWLIAGAWSQLIYAIRQDITVTLATEAVIQNNAGAITYNLFQQDMVALRIVIRLGFALPNPINAVNTNAATRFPFAVLTA